MPKTQITGAAGLFSAPSDFFKPPNALDEAKNILLRDQGIIEPRRGMLKQGAGYDTDTDANNANKLVSFFNNLYFLSGDKVYFDDGTGWFEVSTDIGASVLGKDDGVYPRQNAVEFLQNLYISSQNGLYMTDTVGAQLFKAGFSTPPPAVVDPLSGVTSGVGSWSWKNNTTGAVAYRVVWGRKDAHDRIILGEPSGRTIVKNTTGASALVKGDVPAVPEATSDTFYQVYRSWSVDTSVAGMVPSDDLYQVYEALAADPLTLTGAAGSRATKPNGSSVVTVNKTAHGYRERMTVAVSFAAGDTGANELVNGVYRITYVDADNFTYDDLSVNGSVSPYTNLSSATVTPKSYPFDDYSKEEILSSALYTNPVDGDGLAVANTQPPASTDLAVWKNRLWFANTNIRHSYILSLVGTNSGLSGSEDNPDGLQANDTVTLDGVVYTAKAAPAANTAEFKVYTGGTSASDNIRDTCKSLIEVVNNWRLSTVRANYISADNDRPGFVRFERPDIEDSQFNVSVSKSSAWAPYITSTTSKNDNFTNRLFFSKPNQPEAVPALNYIDVGAGNKAIIRILPVKDTLFIFKEDGIFSITGDYPFRCDLVDANTLAISPLGLIAGEACIYGLFNTGICRVDSTGAKIISTQIADKLRQISGRDLGMCCALNEIDGIFLIKLIYTDHTPIWLCYNIRTNAWTTLDFDGHYGFSQQGYIATALFFKPYGQTLTKLHFIFTPPTGAARYSLAIETRLSDPENYNLQFIDGDFNEATDTVLMGASVSGITYGTTGVVAFEGGTLTGAQVGDIVYAGNKTILDDVTAINGGDFFGRIVSIQPDLSSAVVQQVCVVSAGSIAEGATVRLLRSFPVRALYMFSAPAAMRHYRDLTYAFAEYEFAAAESIISTDQNETEVNSTISFSDQASRPTLDTLTQAYNTRFKRILFPAGHQFANTVSVGIQLEEAGSFFNFLGVGLTYEDVSERNSR